MSDNTELEVRPFGSRSLQPPPNGTATALLGAIVPKDLADAMTLAKLLARTEMVPKGYRGKPDDIIVAGMWGAELGLSWVQALKSIAVINGNPGIWGDVGHALMLRSGQLEELTQDWDAAKKVATCTIKRKGYAAKTATFSWAQAVTAGLAGKQTYQAYPDVMCGWRAFWRAARPTFGDIFMGIQGAEEAFDMPDQSAPIPIKHPRSMAEVLEARVVPEIKGAAPLPNPSGATSDEDLPTRVEAADEKTYKDKKTGATKCWWQIKTSDGRVMGTFSESRYATAKRAFEEGLPVIATSEPGKKDGSLNLVEISLAIPDQGAAEPTDSDPGGE